MTPEPTPADLRAQLDALVRGEGVTSLEDLFPDVVDEAVSSLLDEPGEEPTR